MAGSIDIANMFEFISRGDLKSSPNGESIFHFLLVLL